MPGALAGMRVLECGGGAAAGYATKLLADLGADVIKVETPDGGDVTRRRGPFPGSVPHPERSGTFLYLNANKRGITLDLAQPRGREVLARLAGGVDLLVHAIPPAEMARNGLDVEALLRRNPGLILTTISPFGITGPYRDWRAEELTLSNAGGWAWLIDVDAGGAEMPPLKAFGQQAHLQAGMNAAAASLAALLARQLNGAGGQHIDVSIQECVMAFLEMNFVHFSYGGRIASRLGQRLVQPWSILPAKDGLVFLLCVEEDQWRRFVEWMGNPEFAQWEVFADRFARASTWDALRPYLEEWTRQHTVEEIYRGGLERRLAFAPVSTMGDLLRDEHLAVRGFFAEIAHPEAGSLRYPGAPAKLGATPWELRSPAPLLGQHTAVVLAEAGYGAAEITHLRNEGVV